MTRHELALQQYKSMLSNLEWHYDHNGKYETQEALQALKIRINDYREFVQILTALNR